MLYLTRRPGEAVIINNAIEVRVVELKGKTVKLGFTFPADATVLREEVFLQIKAENEAAAQASIEALRDVVGPNRPAVAVPRPERQSQSKSQSLPRSQPRSLRQSGDE